MPPPAPVAPAPDSGPFVPGLELSRLLYEEGVRPVMARHFPDLPYGAARIQAGSDVLGFDTPRSRDHGWGPMLTLFLPRDRFSAGLAGRISRRLGAELPFEVAGVPTHFQGTAGEGLPTPTRRRPVAHRVGVGATGAILERWLGVDPLREAPLEPEEWLAIPEQQLRTVVSGAVYRDDGGALALARERLRWYPRDVWLYLLAAQWLRIEQEEPFMGRAAEVGDELGSRVLAARLVREVMHLAFLMERRYAPYNKWLGSAFAGLACAPRLAPHLEGALRGETWREREGHLCAAYEAAAALHNALGLTAPLDPRTAPFHSRPFRVLNAGRFWRALRDAVADPRLRALMADQHGIVGNTTQWADSTDALAPRWWPGQRALYQRALRGAPRRRATG